MPKAMLFWVLMILWLIFGVVPWPEDKRRYWHIGGTVLVFALFALLGWQVFGDAVK